jgi:hypothetical protein
MTCLVGTTGVAQSVIRMATGWPTEESDGICVPVRVGFLPFAADPEQ